MKKLFGAIFTHAKKFLLRGMCSRMNYNSLNKQCLTSYCFKVI